MARPFGRRADSAEVRRCYRPIRGGAGGQVGSDLRRAHGEAPMSTPDDVVLLEVTDAIARIRFNRPAALNAIDEAVAQGFHSACEAVSRRADVRAIVLSGAGRAFMAGGDVRRMHDARTDAPSLVGKLLNL